MDIQYIDGYTIHRWIYNARIESIQHLQPMLQCLAYADDVLVTHDSCRTHVTLMSHSCHTRVILMSH